ncbi:hypothetical protein DENSPDRAFT_265494 [Dentipellis sp. KUC8613]|nr:hypothetical protein DENSPDRAFT_265494 [Dentipellis sp. KUC8613]
MYQLLSLVVLPICLLQGVLGAAAPGYAGRAVGDRIEVETTPPPLSHLPLSIESTIGSIQPSSSLSSPVPTSASSSVSLPGSGSVTSASSSISSTGSATSPAPSTVTSIITSSLSGLPSSVSGSAGSSGPSVSFLPGPSFNPISSESSLPVPSSPSTAPSPSNSGSSSGAAALRASPFVATVVGLGGAVALYFLALM